ncbi:unnamed protein product, partial [Rotaria sp. Silwood2]
MLSIRDGYFQRNHTNGSPDNTIGNESRSKE